MVMVIRLTQRFFEVRELKGSPKSTLARCVNPCLRHTCATLCDLFGLRGELRSGECLVASGTLSVKQHLNKKELFHGLLRLSRTR